MEFTVEGEPLRFAAEAVIVAGYTGRERATVESHISELAEQGIAPPSSIPAFFSMPTNSAAIVDEVEVFHKETSGEVEVVLVVDGSDIYLGIGSDHTDRRAERLDIGLSKQVCRKPLGPDLWPLDTVRDRWDTLVLSSEITTEGNTCQYQSGVAGANLSPQELLKMIPFRQRPERFVVFTGTIPVIGGIRHADRFEATISDSLMGDSLTLGYEIRVCDSLANGE